MMIFGSNAPNNGLLSLPSLGIGPSSFSHIENNGSKDPTVSFSFRILQRISIYTAKPFRSRPIWALLVFVWPMFSSLFRESTAAKHRGGKIHKREAIGTFCL